MGHCPCFGFLSNRKKLKPEILKADSFFESRGEAGSKVNPNSRKDQSIRTKKDNSNSNSNNNNNNNNSIHVAQTYTYEELAIATNYFSPHCLLGRGGFGAVYKGKLESTGQVVAVKQLDLAEGMQGEKEFLVEVLMLTLMHHPNLVNMLGYCAEGVQRLLVYEFMAMGSLEDHLFDVTPDKKALDWKTRMKIASGAAKGLEYLHNADPPVIYRDLKASNILLSERFHPKLSDFGLAKFGPVGDNSHVSTRVMGTYGYCAPEYASTGRLTLKTDIYTFGVLLLELITGYRAVDEIYGRKMHLIHWALPIMRDRNDYFKLADPLLRGQYSASVFNKAVEVASTCLNENASLRPSSSDLVTAIEFLRSCKYNPKDGLKGSLEWPEIDVPPNLTAVVVEKELDRDRAVAEAKMWGESWREKRRQSPLSNATIR